MVATASPTQIETADRQRGIASLALAFAADPVMRWFWPDADRYARGWPAFAEAFGGQAFDHRTAYGLENCVAVALWLPPGLGVDEDAFFASIRASVDGQIVEQATPFFEQMDRYHPSTDHWYLPLTGVDPVAQGRGLGSELLRHALETCDHGLPAYLEATSPRSRDLYRRHGFRVIGNIRAGSIPPMWAMLREPAVGGD